MRIPWFAAAVAVLAAVAGPARAQSGFVVPSQVLPPAGTPFIVNGEPASGSDWPATLVATIGSGQARFLCTATVIGPRVVLTAAHCVDDGATMAVALPSGAATVRCSHHPDYAPDENYRNDIALCLSAATIALTPGERYERLNTDPAVPVRGEQVTLLGYGCTRPDGEASSFLFTGTAPVNRLRDNKIALGAGAVLCEGDSGGAAYRGPSSGARRVIGVNSTRGLDFRSSNVTNVAAPEIAAFIADWSRRNDAPVCGRGAADTLCRS